MTTARTRLTALGLLAAALGCGRSQGDAQTAGPPQPQLAVAPAEPTPAPAPAPQPAPQPPPAPPPTPVQLPNDAGGKTVAAALAPGVPPTPVLPRTPGPKPRTSALDRGELPLPPITARMPPVPPPASSKPPRPSPPPERVPADLGQSAAEDPSRLRLPERPLAKGPAATLTGPADLPPLARQLPDRAPLDDPTAEIAAARAVLTAMPLPFHPDWFARFGIPDPFELAGHLRGKLGRAAELGTTPADVPPARP